MSTTKPTSKQEEALQFLDDLDSFTPVPPSSANGDRATSSAPPPAPGEAAEVLAFLDEITQKSSEPPKSTASILAASTSRPASTTPGASPTLNPGLSPTARRSNDSARSARASPVPSARAAAAAAAQQQQQTHSASSSVWGWGNVLSSNVLSSATAVLQQAKSVADEQVKQLQQLPNSEHARKWGEGVLGYVKSANLDKLGQELKTAGLSTFTEILNAVAPPIAEHEVIQVWLSHDMHGYEGVENLVYRSLTKILEQVEGGDLVVNKGNESVPSEAGQVERERNLNAVDGYDQALKLSHANLEDLIKAHAEAPPLSRAISQQNPTTYSSVFLRIQPYFTTIALQPSDPTSPQPTEPSAADKTASKRQLQFLIHLSDPTHTLLHTQVTQGVPAEWLEIWDDNEWVEDMVVEAIRLGVEIIGQEYVVARMGWMRKGEAPKEEEAKQV